MTITHTLHSGFLFYLFIGSLATSVFDSDVYLIGASGGVYALLAAHLANLLLNYRQLELGFLRLVGVFVVGKLSQTLKSCSPPCDHFLIFLHSFRRYWNCNL